LLGPNGVGKTTLLSTLAGIRSADQGTIRLNDQPMDRMTRKAIAKKLGMLTQNTRFAFDADCLETALSGRHPHLGSWSGETEGDRMQARAALEQLGLAHLSARSCTQLSGGEQRRLALATVLTQNPDVLLLDEPTNHLDPAHQLEILNCLWRRVKNSARAQFMALHDINLATCYCTHVLMLFGNGRWRAGKAGELLNETMLSELYQCNIRVIQDEQQTVFAIAGPGNP